MYKLGLGRSQKYKLGEVQYWCLEEVYSLKDCQPHPLKGYKQIKGD